MSGSDAETIASGSESQKPLSSESREFVPKVAAHVDAAPFVPIGARQQTPMTGGSGALVGAAATTMPAGVLMMPTNVAAGSAALGYIGDSNGKASRKRDHKNKAHYVGGASNSHGGGSQHKMSRKHREFVAPLNSPDQFPSLGAVDGADTTFGDAAQNGDARSTASLPNGLQHGGSHSSANWNARHTNGGGGGRGGGRRGRRNNNGGSTNGYRQQQQQQPQQHLSLQQQQQQQQHNAFIQQQQQHQQMAQAFASPYYATAASMLPSMMVIDDVTVQQSIADQVEYYFSADNLAKDMFLRSHMDANGWVHLGVLHSFHRVQMLTPHVTVVRDAVRACSSSVEVSEDGFKVRRINGWEAFVLPSEYRVQPNGVPVSPRALSAYGDSLAASSSLSPANSSDANRGSPASNGAASRERNGGAASVAPKVTSPAQGWSSLAQKLKAEKELEQQQVQRERMHAYYEQQRRQQEEQLLQRRQRQQQQQQQPQQRAAASAAPHADNNQNATSVDSTSAAAATPSSSSTMTTSVSWADLEDDDEEAAAAEEAVRQMRLAQQSASAASTATSARGDQDRCSGSDATQAASIAATAAAVEAMTPNGVGDEEKAAKEEENDANDEQEEEEEEEWTEVVGTRHRRDAGAHVGHKSAHGGASASTSSSSSRAAAASARSANAKGGSSRRDAAVSRGGGGAAGAVSNIEASLAGLHVIVPSSSRRTQAGTTYATHRRDLERVCGDDIRVQILPDESSLLPSMPAASVGTAMSSKETALRRVLAIGAALLAVGTLSKAQVSRLEEHNFACIHLQKMRNRALRERRRTGTLRCGDALQLYRLYSHLLRDGRAPGAVAEFRRMATEDLSFRPAPGAAVTDAAANHFGMECLLRFGEAECVRTHKGGSAQQAAALNAFVDDVMLDCKAGYAYGAQRLLSVLQEVPTLRVRDDVFRVAEQAVAAARGGAARIKANSFDVLLSAPVIRAEEFPALGDAKKAAAAVRATTSTVVGGSSSSAWRRQQ